MSDTKVTPDAEKPETTSEEKTYTQAEVEAMIRGRLAKFSDYEQIKAELETFKAESQTEQERAVSEARKAARTETLTEVNTRLVNAEARALASEAGWLYPQDAHRYIDPKSITVNDDGTVDVESVKTALTEAVTERPALVKSGESEPEVPSPSNAGIGVQAPAKPRNIADQWATDIGSK